MRLELQLPADLGPDELHPPDLGLAERGVARRAPAAIVFARVLRGPPSERQADDELPRVAELLDDAVAEPDRAERRPDAVDGRGLARTGPARGCRP